MSFESHEVDPIRSRCTSEDPIVQVSKSLSELKTLTATRRASEKVVLLGFLAIVLVDDCLCSGSGLHNSSQGAKVGYCSLNNVLAWIDMCNRW